MADFKNTMSLQEWFNSYVGNILSNRERQKQPYVYKDGPIECLVIKPDVLQMVPIYPHEPYFERAKKLNMVPLSYNIILPYIERRLKDRAYVYLFDHLPKSQDGGNNWRIVEENEENIKLQFCAGSSFDYTHIEPFWISKNEQMFSGGVVYEKSERGLTCNELVFWAAGAKPYIVTKISPDYPVHHLDSIVFIPH